MEQINIKDESGDKKYFTIIPNYILNHSTANDQALYMQMKRIAGDNGKCEAGVRYFTKQLGLGASSVRKSVKYLIEHHWIDYIGKSEVKTRCGVQKVNTYKVNEIKTIFKTLAKIKGIEATGSPKLMHLKLPRVFVMWDSYIRDAYAYENGDADDYVCFLKEMQKKFSGLKGPADRTLAKAIDEHNYKKYTMPALEKARKQRKKE